MRLQVHRRYQKLKRIKGVLVCHNIPYPARLYCRTTVHRDSNGARYIALIGFTALISSDNESLPPFGRTKKAGNIPKIFT